MLVTAQRAAGVFFSPLISCAAKIKVCLRTLGHGGGLILESKYLCAVKDACSKRIVGYSMDERMTSELAVNALRNVVAVRGPVDATVHSNRGSQGGLNWSSQHFS